MLIGLLPGNQALEVWLVAPPFSMLEGATRLALELQRRGHVVRVGSTDKAEQEVKEAGLQFMNFGKHPVGAARELEEAASSSHGRRGLKASVAAEMKPFDVVDKVIRAGMAREHPLPDVLVCSGGCGACGAFGAAERLPFLWLLPSTVLPSPLFARLPYLPSAHTEGFRFGATNVWQRANTALHFLLVSLVWPLTGWPSDAFRDTLANVPGRLVLVPSSPGLDYPQHTSPLVHYTGPLLAPADTEAGRLSDDITSWLEVPRGLPVLLLSLGTEVSLTGDLCRRLLETVSAASGAGEWRLLWALPGDQRGCLGHGAARLHAGGFLLISPRIAAPAALAHGKVMAMVGHCGSGGHAAEAVWAGKPFLGLSLLGDLGGACARMRASGVAVVVDGRPELEPKELRAAAGKLLAGRNFGAASRKLGHLARTYGGVGRAADLVEAGQAMGTDLNILRTPVERQGAMVAFCFDLVLLLATTAVCCCGLGFARCRNWTRQGSHRKEE